MMDGTNLNVLQTSRQMLRAFGGLNEGYGCSEAEFSGEMNFSSRGYPALQRHTEGRFPKKRSCSANPKRRDFPLTGSSLSQFA